ncbi:hypothetical protein EDD70_1054 [Hydrogenoanaerobacterium saccharovorans]|uniref:Uncharacterized protein n=1 Tax=Hydrogenoanaerobacterium saccharovorans TaxID=474960 RepID=A0A1H8A359_9FIRM|nr:hypothetical protein EDD70_1054 [Hydrogenoanaerobacterium saccharovorans]SEM64278.1 hypothetical protein SAMN05216180_1037 [Hydrogenoanaerobacterium saccharovorans]
MKPKIRPPPFCKDTLDDFGYLGKARAVASIERCNGFI